MDIIRKQPEIAAGVAVVLGFVLGLIFGWYVMPVEWEGGGPEHLAQTDQEIYLLTLADNYESDGNPQRVQQALAGWEGAVPAICELAAVRPSDAVRLNNLAAALNQGQGCIDLGGTAVTDETAAEGRSPLLTIVFLLFLLLGGAAVAFFVLASRRTTAMERAPSGVYSEMPTTVPETTVGARDTFQATPVARFRTTYTRGHDTYDDSFSIENGDGDFLGECGMGVSESIGSDTPKNVTAFEVWLFDKNDIRTVTRVIMSDHAFFDEGFKAKLAPKGEPVLARPNETIVLETASLIINAEITEMEYGAGAALPEDSYFERITVELSAWAKEGDFDEPDIQGRIDEMLDY